MSEFNRTELKERRRELRRNETQAERVLWQELRSKKLGCKFYRQYSVEYYVLDFYCPKFYLAIELDGGHHDNSDIKEADKVRTAYLRGYGIKVVRFKNMEVLENLTHVLNEIKAACSSPS